jgi:hypothetical protein
VYREKERHWTGPHVVAPVDGKEISVQLGETTGPRRLNICQVKPSLLSAQVMFLKSVIESKEVTNNIWWTEVIAKNDPRPNSMAMKEAIQKEINALFQGEHLNLSCFQIQQLKRLAIQICIGDQARG